MTLWCHPEGQHLSFQADLTAYLLLQFLLPQNISVLLAFCAGRRWNSVTTQGSVGYIKEKGVYAAYVTVRISEQMSLHPSCSQNRILTVQKRCAVLALHFPSSEYYKYNVNGIIFTSGLRISKSLATTRWYMYPVKGKPLLLKSEKTILALQVVLWQGTLRSFLHLSSSIKASISCCLGYFSRTREVVGSFAL